MAWSASSKLVRFENESRGAWSLAACSPSYRTLKNGKDANENADFDWSQKAPQVRCRVTADVRPSAPGTQDVLSLNLPPAYLGNLPGVRSSIGVSPAKIRALRPSIRWARRNRHPGRQFPPLHLRAMTDSVTKIWVALDHQRLPVKIRFTDKKGEVFGTGSLGSKNQLQTKHRKPVLPPPCLPTLRLSSAGCELSSTGDAVVALLPRAPPISATPTRPSLPKRCLRAPARAQHRRCAGQSPTVAACCLAVVVRGWSQRELAPVLKAGQREEWLAGANGRASDADLPAVRCDLPDWLLHRRLSSLVPTRSWHFPGADPVGPASTCALIYLNRPRHAARCWRPPTLLPPPGALSPPPAVRLRDKLALAKHPLFLEGAEVQDEGSQLLGFLLEPKRGEMVVDFAPARAARRCCSAR